MTYLDTHVVIWLHAGEPQRLSSSAQNAVIGPDLLISPMVLMELQFLHEIGRLTAKPDDIIRDLALSLSVSVCQQSFEKVAREAASLVWTRDPFDRIIVAQASAADAALVTKDKTIRDNYSCSIW